MIIPIKTMIILKSKKNSVNLTLHPMVPIIIISQMKETIIMMGSLISWNLALKTLKLKLHSGTT